MNPAIVSALAIAAGVFLVNAIGYGGGDGDLWWQRQLGEAVLRTHSLPTTLGAATFSAPDARWIPHEWIFATLWALAKRAGAGAAFGAFCAAIALLTIGVEAVRSRAASPAARMAMLVIVALALTPSFGLRAQILGWPLLALVMLALESGPRRAWLAVPIAVVWYNLHASGLIVPCIVLVYGIGLAVEGRRLAAGLPSLALAGACALASLATPFGSALPRFTVSWSSNPATGLIYEWAPASPDKILILAGTLVIALLLIAGEFRGARMTWPQRLLAMTLFAATMLHIRNLGPFCIVAGPWVAASLGALLPSEDPARKRSWRTDGGLAALGIATAVVMVALRLHTPLPPNATAHAVADVTALPGPLRVACEDFSWCSRFADDGQVRVFLDGRTDAYPDAVYTDLRRMLRGDALPVFAHWQVNAAIVHDKGALAKTLRAAGWTLLRKQDPQVYLRPGREAAEPSTLERLDSVHAHDLG